MEPINNFLVYMFEKAPSQAFNFYQELLIISAILIISGIGFSFFYNKKRKTDPAFKRLFKSVGGKLQIFGLTFLILIGLRYEQIPYFSMRLWLYLTIAIFLYQTIKTFKIFKVEYPIEKANIDSFNQHMNSKKDQHELKYSTAKRKK